jgi:hypothetical protein
MLQMPIQRQQLALQHAQFDQQRNQEALRIALAQKTQAANQQLGASQLDLHHQELMQNQQQHEAALEVQREKINAMRRGEYNLTETKGGVPLLYNRVTGETKPIDLGGVGGLGGLTHGVTGTAQMNNDTKLAQMFPIMHNSSMTNFPALMNQYSNVTAQALGRLQDSGAYSGGLGAQPQPTQPPVNPAIYNVPTRVPLNSLGALQSAGQMPMTPPTIPGLGAISTNTPMTNSPIKIGKYLVQ